MKLHHFIDYDTTDPKVVRLDLVLAFTKRRYGYLAQLPGDRIFVNIPFSPELDKFLGIVSPAPADGTGVKP